MAMHERTEKKRSSEDFRTEVRETGPNLSSPAPSGGITNNSGLAIAGYCCASILMTLTNKYVVSGTRFNLNFLLLAMQSIVCLGAIEVLKVFRVITFRNFNKEEAKLWFPISVLLVGMIYTGSKSLQFLSVPVYTIFKNLTIICIAYGEVLWFGANITPLTMVSFLLMVISSIVAAWADIHNTAAQSVGATSYVNIGYIWMMVNCFCSAAFVLIMRKRIKLTKFKDFDTMFYNNLLSIPVLFVATFTLEDWTGANLVRNFPPETRVSLFSAIIFSGLSTVAISYTSAWCIRITSSTTYSMVGALNKLPIALSGLLFFGDPVTFFSVTAIFLGFLAGLVYAVAKSNQAKAVPALPK